MSRCNSCGKTIRWVRMVSGARRLMPLDPDPLPSGSILMLAKGDGRLVPIEQRAQCVAPLFASHFETCPSADARRPCRPLRALSLTQPWAWLVVHGGKTIENRRWRTAHRGPFLIHAAKGMTGDQYNDAILFALEVDPAIVVPSPHELERGGIVGIATISHVLEPTSAPTVPWHMPDQFGFALVNVQPLPFHPCKGSLGFWGDFDLRDGKVEQRAARWASEARQLQ